MSVARISVLCVWLISALPSVHADTLQRDEEVATAAKAMRGKIVAWRRDIHQHPELGNREVRTSKLVADHLRTLGLEPKTGIAHTGVIALLRGGKPGPRIALRADMDALPVFEQTDLPFASKVTATYSGQTTGVMHACGHDAHTAILMGVAETLAAAREELPGEILFIFQPAEEGPPAGEEGGASLMLKEGIFRDFKPQAIFGLHVFSTLNAGQIGVRSGPAMAASDSFIIKVIGRQSHGSMPWAGIDPIVTAAQIVTGAQTIVSRQLDISRRPAVVTFGMINGGIRFNIIPDNVELIGTIRTFDEGMRKDVFARLNRMAENIAAANGATIEARIPAAEGSPVTFNNENLTARMRPSLEKVVGTAGVVNMPYVMGAEDFSLYAREVPGLFFFVGSTPVAQDAASAPSNHSPKYFVDESALDVGFRAMLQVALDYLHDAD